MHSMKALTPKQSAFVREYLIDLNGTQAAIRAGYSPRTASEQAARLLADVNVKAAVQAAMDARAERTEITADAVLQEVARIAFLDPRKLFTDDGKLIPVALLDRDTATAIGGMDVIEKYSQGGELMHTIKKVKLESKLAALDKLMRHLGLYEKDNKQQGNAAAERLTELLALMPKEARGIVPAPENNKY